MLEPRMVKLMQEGRKTAATASEIRIKSSVNQRARMSKQLRQDSQTEDDQQVHIQLTEESLPTQTRT